MNINITRMHALGQGTLVYQKGTVVPNVHEVNTPASRAASDGADIWFVTHETEPGSSTGRRIKNNDRDLQFTLIFTDRFGHVAVLWSNEPVKQQTDAWRAEAE